MATVRIPDRVKDVVKKLAEESGKTMTEVLEISVDIYRREKFFEECNKAYLKLKANPELWASELAEREEWDITLDDGEE